MVSIGSVTLDNPFVLAPMAGIGDPPFRRLCRRGGAGLVCAEMVSSNALHFNDEKSERMLQIFPDEHPVSMQIFGSDPERLASAAQKAVAAGADIVDLNCGCPVPKITKTGAGIGLMRDEFLFMRCVEAMAKAVSVPVTVKMRIGFKRGQNRAVRFVRLAQEAGAAAVSVHARSQEDRHQGPANLEALGEVVASVKIPVFGNGGVNTYADAQRMMDETGCAGVLIGQAAVGNPLIFFEFLRDQAKAKGINSEQPDFVIMNPFDLLREHARLITEYYGEDLGIRRLRKYLASYVHDLPFAADFRGRAYAVKTLSQLEVVIADYVRLVSKKDKIFEVGASAA